MAQNKQGTTTGGNKPKPTSGQGGRPDQGAKDKSKAQSRQVSAKAAGRGSGGRGGNVPKGGARPGQSQPKRGISGTMLAWGAVGVVIVIVAVLVIVKVTGSSTANLSYTPVTPAPASVVNQVISIPSSVYDTVGITSSTIPVSAPTVINGQPPMSIRGKSPAMIYYGAEYCPYCAAERWAMTAALSRFGTWSGLKVTASSHSDVYPQTNTFSYYGATLTSPYLAFASIEQYTNVPLASGPGYTTLENPTAEEKAIIAKYSSTTFVPSNTQGIGFPFIDINNRVLISGASFDPGALAGLTWQQIASGLNDPTNPVTQAIVATANYISASICSGTKGAPASVCTSSGVQAAAKALKLTI